MQKLFLSLSLFTFFLCFLNCNSFAQGDLLEQMQEKLKEAQAKKKSDGKPNRKPTKPPAAANFLIGKWEMKNSWKDANNNWMLDGKEKIDNGKLAFSIEFKADGSMCHGIPFSSGKEGKNAMECNSIWTYQGKTDNAHIVKVSDVVSNKNEAIWSIRISNGKDKFVVHMAPYNPNKKESSNESSKRLLFVKK